MTQSNASHRKKRIWKALNFWISVALSFLLAFVYVYSQPEFALLPPITILETIENTMLDIRFRLRGPIQPHDDIVIVAIDEKTDDALGRWQSSGRKWLAELVQFLHEAGAVVVGFDFTLAEPGEGPALAALQDLLATYERTTTDAPAIRNAMRARFQQATLAHDYDYQLGEAIEEAGNVVLGNYHFFKVSEAEHLTPDQQAAYEELISRSKYPLIQYPKGVERQPLRVPHSFGVEPNLPIFSSAAKRFGHFNVIASHDGYVRHVPLIIEYQGNYYPSLDIEIIRAAIHPSPLPIIHAFDKQVGGNIHALQLGRVVLPVDEKGRLFINFYGPGKTFPHYSLSDVILKNVPPETFQSKVVLVGFTASIYQDVHPTTFQAPDYPGVEVHATVIENILRQDFLIKPEWAIGVNALVLLFLGLLLGILLHHIRPHFGALTVFLGLTAIAISAHLAFIWQKIWLNVTYPMVFIVLDYLLVTSYKYFTEERKRRQVKNAFEHYVSPSVVNLMLDRVDQLQLGGERKELTALFSDIRGFTSISERMKPDELVKFLNEYLSAMTRIVLNYEGTVDKYMGDAIMAFYGAPLGQADHAVRACRTAVDMMTRLRDMQQEWAARGLPRMDIGIGINTGEMSVGNMGSEERFDYTIMGDNVNLASRLEGINKQYGTNIVISESTYVAIQHEPFIARELDAVIVKGKQAPVVIYELCGYGGCSPDEVRRITQFEAGLAAYKHRAWNEALRIFRQIVEAFPEDYASHLYIERCLEYQRTPPPDDWDGVFVMKTK